VAERESLGPLRAGSYGSLGGLSPGVSPGSIGSSPLGPPSTVGSPARPEAARPAGDMTTALKQRNSWEAGSIVEVYSMTLGCWHPGLIRQVTKDKMLHVCFGGGPNGALLEKTLARSDLQLAVFGSNTDMLPTGFKKVPSQSRPGQSSYFDTGSGIKFLSPDLAWRHHIERLIDPSVDPRTYAEPGPSGGSPNVAQFPSSKGAKEERTHL